MESHVRQVLEKGKQWGIIEHSTATVGNLWKLPQKALGVVQLKKGRRCLALSFREVVDTIGRQQDVFISTYPFSIDC